MTPIPARIVIATDKFKGSLRADEVAAHLRAGILAADPSTLVTTVPVADGGDGTLEAARIAGFSSVNVKVTGPSGNQVDSALGLRGHVALVELARASGMALVRREHADALHATSRGTGELIRAALDFGCTEIILGVGGSACTDGGAGMVEALGVRLLDHSGRELPPGGGALDRLARVDLSGLDPRLADVLLVLASDVDNPLLGENGGVYTYGRQKGASSSELELLERSLGRWAELVDPVAASLPGAGAAGGVGFASLAILRAHRRPGVDVVLDLVKFDEKAAGASLVITGEGCLDEQTLRGKAPMGVASAARKAGLPVTAVSGKCCLSQDQLAAAGISRAYALTDLEPDVATCIAAPGRLLETIGRTIGADWTAIPRFASLASLTPDLVLTSKPGLRSGGPGRVD